MTKPAFQYTGNELELFRLATNWKKRVALAVKPYIRGDVAEIGAGPGNFTRYLRNDQVVNWTMVEPDGNFAQRLIATSQNCRVIQGSLQDVPGEELFDSIIYLDVLEHIEADAAELQLAWQHLKPNGYCIVLCPAFNDLYSPFDKAIGHYRRYTRGTLKKAFPGTAQVVISRYLDSAGFLASLLNKGMLKQTYPSRKQVLFWDRILVNISKVTDILLSPFMGRSVLVIAQKIVNR